MKCPNCHAENAESNRFCHQCGARLLWSCSQCGAQTLSGDKFCGECGQRLHEERHLETAIPSTISERKNVTVLFSDLSGYTLMTGRLDPEEVRETMSRIFGEIAQVIAKYEGFIERFIGDAVVAIFGVPKVHEDDAIRAIKAAREIHARVEAMSPQLEESVGQPLSMHTGISSGLVVTGEVNLRRGTHGITGDPMNLASRLQELAGAGEILVSADTYRQAEGYFIFEPMEPRRVKGKLKPVHVYRVIAPSTRRTRFDVSAERGLIPFVGREKELALLLAGFERAKGGRGSSVSVAAEAGAGKSRLLYEFRKALAREKVTFLEGRCLSYGRGAAYHLVTDMLKSNFDIQEGDQDFEVREKVKRGLEILGVDEASALPYLLEILAVKDSGIDKIQMSREARKDRIIETLKQTVLRGSEIRPLILAFEDLQWMDKSSEDALRFLLEGIAKARVFLIFTYRPEFVPTWGEVSSHNQVNLGRLSKRQTLAMVSHILGTKLIDEGIEELILEKTEGVPFFIEEFTKSLKDLEIIERKNNRFHLRKEIHDVTIPSTIQDVIMARVDMLPEGAKDVLQTGSVIQREFGYELIRRIAGLPEQALISNLSLLKDSELLYGRGIHPKSIYIFKHALTREVVYDTILKKRKKKLHEKIGDAIEKLHRDNLDEYCGVLAHHFIAGANYTKGAKYSKLAGLKAEKSAALKDAIEHTKKRVNALERLPPRDELHDEIIDARMTLGFYLFQMGYFKEAKESAEPILDKVKERGPKSALSMVYVLMGTYSYMVEEDHPKSIRYLAEATRISEQVGDFVSFGFANYLLGLVLSFNCDFQKAIYYFERVLNMSMAIQSIWRVSAMKSNLSVYAYDFQGQVSQGYETSAEALRIAEESGDILSKAMAYTNHGTSCYYKGLLEEAEGHLLKGVYLTEKINLMSHSALAHQWLGHTYFELGKYQKAQDHYRETIHLREYSGLLPSSANLNRIALARAKALGGEKDMDLEALYAYAQQNRLKLYEGWIARFLGEILLHIDESHLDAARAWIEKAVEADARNGKKWDLGQDHALYGEYHRRKGEPSKARETLGKAIGIFRECGAEDWVRKWEGLLSKI